MSRRHALDDGEAIADASVRTGDERHQVAIHARKRMRRFWDALPSLRPKHICQIITTQWVREPRT